MRWASAVVEACAPVRRREGIVAIDVAERGEPGGEIGVVGLFAGMEADVFQQQHLGRAGLFGQVFRPVQRLDEMHLAAERLFQRGQGDAQRHGGHHLALGPVEMGKKHGRAAARQDVVDRGHDAFDPCGVGHGTVLDRHVDIDAHQHALAREIHVVQRLPAHPGGLPLRCRASHGAGRGLRQPPTLGKCAPRP